MKSGGCGFVIMLIAAALIGGAIVLQILVWLAEHAPPWHIVVIALLVGSPLLWGLFVIGWHQVETLLENRRKPAPWLADPAPASQDAPPSPGDETVPPPTLG